MSPRFGPAWPLPPLLQHLLPTRDAVGSFPGQSVFFKDGVDDGFQVGHGRQPGENPSPAV
jgi:hypothetical protein